MGLGFGAVIADTETEAAAASTAVARRVTCCATITRGCGRGWSKVGRAAGCRATWGLHG
ncbi:hypothetical protein [Streptomyces sp. MK5]|uniref:hypothetical protein n=1 Tax=Streptomyces sp. MK5 TaxID=3064253 RepID=UPI0027428D10|nr:hypothetical protein [Streptomyces sp. MK5]